MHNLIPKNRFYFFLLVLTILSCANLNDHKKHTMQWNSVSLLLDEENWHIEEDKNKITMEKVNYRGKQRPGIYLEYIQTPPNEQFDIEILLKQAIDVYKLIYDDVQYEAIKIGNVACYKIDHSISKEGKKLQTTIIPIGQEDYIIAVVYAEENDYPAIKKDYDKLISNIFRQGKGYRRETIK